MNRIVSALNAYKAEPSIGFLCLIIEELEKEIVELSEKIKNQEVKIEYLSESVRDNLLISNLS